MFCVSNVFSAFTTDARDARHILPMRKDRNRILGSPWGTLPYSLAETGNQATKCSCIHSTGFGRLSVICHGQARGHDRFVVNWIEPYHGSYSALSKSSLPTPSIFCPFVHRSVLLLSLLGLSVVSIHH